MPHDGRKNLAHGNPGAIIKYMAVEWLSCPISPENARLLRRWCRLWLVVVCSLAALAPAAFAAEAENIDLAGVRRQLPFYASLLPADTVAVISASDIEGMLKGARSSSFGRLIASDAGLAASIESRLRRARAIISVVTALPDSPRGALLAGGCAVALLAGPPDAAGKGRIPFLILLDVSRLKAGARKNLETSLMAALRFVLGDKADFIDKATVEADASGAQRGPSIGRVHEIKLGEGEDQRFAIGFLDGFPAGENGGGSGAAIIAGLKPDVLAAFKNATSDEPPPLAGNRWFRNIMKELKPGAGLTGYVNVDELIRQLDLRRPDRRRAEVLGRLGVGSVPCFGLRTTFEPGPGPDEKAGRIVDSLFVPLRRPRVSWMSFLPTTQSRLQGATFVPKDFDLYVSIDLGKGDDVWHAIRTTYGEMAGGAALQWLDSLIESIEMPFGISIQRDIFGSIDGEMFFAIDLDNLSESIAEGGIEAEKTPYILGFRTSRKDILAGALDRVLESEVVWNLMGFDKERYKVGGYELTKLTSFVEPRFTQGYGFVDGYFLFSPQHTAIERAVEAHRTGANLASDPGYAALRAKMPDKSNGQVFLRTSVLYRELIDAYAPWLADRLRPAAQALLAGAEDMTDSVAWVTLRDDGILAVVSSPMGIGGACVSVRELEDASVRRKLALTRERFDTIAAAIDRFRAAHGAFPKSLGALVPEFLPDVPEDPFAVLAWMRAALPIRYRCSQPQRAGDKVVRAGGYVLAGNGPNGRADFDVKEFNPVSWSERYESDAAADVDAMKAQLYQFRKERHADERRLDDEGDVVIAHIVEPEEGGTQ